MPPAEGKGAFSVQSCYTFHGHYRDGLLTFRYDDLDVAVNSNVPQTLGAMLPPPSPSLFKTCLQSFPYSLLPVLPRRYGGCEQS